MLWTTTAWLSYESLRNKHTFLRLRVVNGISYSLGEMEDIQLDALAVEVGVLLKQHCFIGSRIIGPHRLQALHDINA